MSFAVWALVVAPLAADEPAIRNHRVRSTHSRVIQVLRVGHDHAETVRRLLQYLEGARVIVHIDVAPLPGRLGGRTRLVVASQGWRYIRVDIEPGLSDRGLLEMLAHELQHAAEITRAKVSTQLELIELYKRIGQPCRGLELSHCFDTHAAIQTGLSAVAEVDASLGAELLSAKPEITRTQD